MTGKKLFSLEEMVLFNRGKHYRSYYTFGAHIVKRNGQKGVHFAVWAPNAKIVHVVGDFNQWDGTQHPMTLQGQTGVWTLFISGLQEGQVYKYQIETQTGEILHKADPFGFYAEKRPQTASIVYALEKYPWQDQDWLRKREQRDSLKQPMLIYEAHLGTWKCKEDQTFYTYRELADELVPYLLEMGFTHLELLPVMEHPFDGSWGYQITGYYAATSRYGEPKDLMYLIDRCHQAGIGVILDWVPGHFCKDVQGLSRFDGNMLFEREEHQEWGTYKFDFSRFEVWSFLISNALFWLDRYHVDGLRVDGVTSMLLLNFGTREGEQKTNLHGGNASLEAMAFLRQLNRTVAQSYPNVLMIAEESTDWPQVTGDPEEGGLGFHYKWNMGWMNDTLRYIKRDFVHRKWHHQELTFSLVYAFHERFILPFSHDEVVHGKKSMLDKMPGDYWRKFAGWRLLYLYQMTHPGKKLLFMGGEFGQFIEWRDDRALDWFLLDLEKHRQFHDYVRFLNKLYQAEQALWARDLDWDGFEWIDVNNAEQSILSFLRKGTSPEESLLVILNFLPDTYGRYRVGVDQAGEYEVLLNSDWTFFGGTTALKQAKLLSTAEVPFHGKKHSLCLKIPPLGGVLLKRRSS